MEKEQTLTKEQALQKLRHFCAYQERCHQEVKDKLYGYGLHRKEVDEAIAGLIEENYLNEERFAIQFAGGRFRLKHWGRNKIKYELKKRFISDYCIRKALRAIDEDEYIKTLEKLANDKWEALRSEKNALRRKHKTISYLLQKGYESDLITSLDIFRSVKK